MLYFHSVSRKFPPQIFHKWQIRWCQSPSSCVFSSNTTLLLIHTVLPLIGLFLFKQVLNHSAIYCSLVRVSTHFLPFSWNKFEKSLKLNFNCSLNIVILTLWCSWYFLHYGRIYCSLAGLLLLYSPMNVEDNYIIITLLSIFDFCFTDIW